MTHQAHQLSYRSTVPTLYPHLDALVNALQTNLKLAYPIVVYANLESVSIQGTPCVALIAEESSVLDVVGGARQIKTLRFQQYWTVVVILRDAGDQEVTAPLLRELGEWQASILNVLCNNVIEIGGPIKFFELQKPEAIAGGAVAGRLRFGIQFGFNVE